MIVGALAVDNETYEQRLSDLMCDADFAAIDSWGGLDTIAAFAIWIKEPVVVLSIDYHGRLERLVRFSSFFFSLSGFPLV